MYANVTSPIKNAWYGIITAALVLPKYARLQDARVKMTATPSSDSLGGPTNIPGPVCNWSHRAKLSYFKPLKFTITFLF